MYHLKTATVFRLQSVVYVKDKTIDNAQNFNSYIKLKLILRKKDTNFTDLCDS
jgi:hypothetical protein